MTLKDVVAQLETLDEDAILVARRPWSAGSEVRLVEPDEEGGVPEDVVAEGFDYFLEVEVAREVLEPLVGREDVPLEKKLEGLIYYATHDAFPDWEV